VPLPAFAADRLCCRRAVQRSIAIYCRPGAEQQTRSSGVLQANDGTDGQKIKLTDFNNFWLLNPGKFDINILQIAHFTCQM